MPPTPPTPTWRYANALVNGGIDAFITDLRKAGASFYDIALELYLATGREIKVTPETVRSWSQKTEDAA